MEADREVGWAIQKPIPSFWIQYLRTAVRLPPWDLVAVKVFPDFTRVATSFSDLSLSRPKVVFLVGPEPAQCRGRRTLGRALNPAAYSGDSTGDRETDSSVLCFIIFNCLIISFAFAFTTPFSHTAHISPYQTDDSCCFTACVSFKPGGGVYNYCHSQCSTNKYVAWTLEWGDGKRVYKRL